MVDAKLNNLPASTYQLIEKMVEIKVAGVEKTYRIIAVVSLAAITMVSAAFYKITAENASDKVSKAIADSTLGKTLKDADQAGIEIQNSRTQLTNAAVEAKTSAANIKTILRGLEKQDNFVRYSDDGNLVLNGTLSLQDANGSRICLSLDSPFGGLKISQNGEDVLKLDDTGLVLSGSLLLGDGFMQGVDFPAPGSVLLLADPFENKFGILQNGTNLLEKFSK